MYVTSNLTFSGQDIWLLKEWELEIRIQNVSTFLNVNGVWFIMENITPLLLWKLYYDSADAVGLFLQAANAYSQMEIL